MKALSEIRGWRRKTTLIILAMFALAGIAEAQLPNCVNGTTMYAVFNNAAGSTTADSMEIRSVNVATGAIGNLMGGKRYWIRKRLGTTSTYYYGSAGLGVDLVTNRFYVMTQMSSAMPKDIVTIDPVTATTTVIGTTPSGTPNLNNYHFVKVAISPNGYGYAIGVNRDSTQAANQCNPLIRFTTCGAVPTANCSTIELLGYLPATGNMYKWLLFNGDIAFDIYGNLYFATAAFEYVNGVARYTNARLFSIDASDIPNAAGTGTIPMSFLADYDGLDSTVINGIGLDGTGHMYLTTRRFQGVQASTPPPSVSELYNSPFPGSATNVTPFAPITANYSVADLASCYFPQAILGVHRMPLTYKYENGHVNLKWNVTNNNQATHFEVQRSNDGNNFETIATIAVGSPDHSSASYVYSDPQNGYDKNKFYRIRQVLTTGARLYSNVVNVTFKHQMSISAGARPNPFVNQFDAVVWLRSANNITVNLIDQSGRTVYRNVFSGRSGDNKLSIQGVGKLAPGVYVVEMAVNDEVLREKLIKQ